MKLGLFGEEMAGGHFFLGLQLAALLKCEGFVEQKKLFERILE